MDSNRFHRRPLGPAGPPLPPSPPGPAELPAGAFVIMPTQCFFPAGGQFAPWQQALYQWAFNQAQELLKPSLYERDWLGVWN